MNIPEDYAHVAPLVNLIWSEPTTPERLKADEDQIPPGQLHYNEAGELMGWDRPRWVAEDECGDVLAYGLVWRSPWTEPGSLMHTIVVRPDCRGRGVGKAMYNTIYEWAVGVKASRLIDYLNEADEGSIAFAVRRGYVKERHVFESMLELGGYDGGELMQSISQAEVGGIRFATLADEPGEASERKVYELYKTTTFHIPGYTGEFPWFEEWRKWSIGHASVKPAWVHIAKDGEEYIGVVTLQLNEQTGALYQEYTGVLPAYRGRRIALALKMLGVQTALASGAPYLRTHNDSMNAPMLRINRDLMGFRAEPGQYKMVRTL
ncbi:GNAT family N-acetyltransferase [Paenibacillus sp. J5C_2022]|nr:GNAT family N-acetyltransferase [Paenibacillus sp. J5C2022]